MDPQIFVFFEGDKNWWCCYRLNENQKVHVNEIIDNFLEKLKTILNINLTIDDVLIYYYNFKSPILDRIPLDDYKKNIQDLSADNSIEIFVQTKNYKPIIKKEKINTELAASFVSKGREFQEKGFNIDARDFFQAADIYGYLDLAKLYFNKHMKEQLKLLLPRMKEIFPNNRDVNLMALAYCTDSAQYKEYLALAYRHLDSCFGNDKFFHLFSLAKIHIGHNEYDKAQECLNNAKAINDCHPIIAQLETEIQIALKDAPNAITMALRSPMAYKYLSTICQMDHGYANLQQKVFNSKDIYYQTFFTPKALADIGKNLFKYGSVNYAVTFLREAYLSKSEVEIVYQLLKILHIMHSKQQFLEILKNFINLNQNEIIPGINFKDLLPMFANIDTKLISKNISRQTFTSLPPGGLPIIKLMMLISCFLYSFANYSNAYDIRLKIRCYSNPIRSIKFGNVKRMFQSCDKPPPNIGRMQEAKLAIVGDEYVYTAGPIPFLTDEEKLSFKTEYFAYPGLSIHDLTKSEFNSGIKAIFLQNMLSISKHFNYVILSFGTIDCAKIIPKAIQDLEYLRVANIVVDLINPYVDLILEYKESSTASIYVHPAYMFEATQPISDIFNKVLASKLAEHKIYLAIDRHLPYAPTSHDSKSMNSEYHSALRREIENHINAEKAQSV